MSSDKPTCNQCGAEISWNKTVRDNFGIKGPLEPDESKKHTCDEQRKTAFKANKAAEDLARDKAKNMGNSNNNSSSQQLSTANEVFLKGMLEEQRRQTDLLVRIAASIENSEFYLRKIDNSQEWFEKLFEYRFKLEDLPERNRVTEETVANEKKKEIENAVEKGETQLMEASQ